MHRHATQVLRIKDNLATSDDIQKLIKTAEAIKVALVRTKSIELLDKETRCCSLATD